MYRNATDVSSTIIVHQVIKYTFLNSICIAANFLCFSIHGKRSCVDTYTLVYAAHMRRWWGCMLFV